MEEYSKRLTEVDEILNYLDFSFYNKIPKDIINVIKENKDKNYTWKYDKTKELKDQNVHKDTICILEYLNINYLLNEKQKEIMEKIHFSNQAKLERKKKENYDGAELFKKRILQIENYEETKALTIKNENWLIKLLKRLFHKNP